jgi:hypothetical protein
MFWVSGLGFGVQGLELRVWGLGFRVQGFWFGILGSHSRLGYCVDEVVACAAYNPHA